jgi:protoporphyrinogen/coproporphyrinogen III oxidase
VRVAVIGGGISGLAAAWELHQRAAAGAIEVTVFEADRLGGCIRTTDFAGHPVDEGPDAFLTRVPEAVQLCRELGIADELVAPAAGRSMLWWRGRLRALPDGLVLGVPRQLRPLIGSGVLSPLGVLRAGLDLCLPRGRPPASLTVRELIAGRFGAEVADRLVDPLVGGIHAGSTRDLGAAEVVPQLVGAAERSRSLLLALRAQGAPSPAGPNQPIFLAPRAGVSRLVDVLVDRLTEAGTRIEHRTVESVRAGPDGGVVLSSGDEPFDAAVIATRARTAAGLLGDGIAGSALAEIPTASVVLVTVSLPGTRLPPGVNGFLVPAGSGRLMTACSFASNKWPHWADPGDAVVRLSAGRFGDDRSRELDDDALSDRLLAELEEALGESLSPATVRVSRWPDAFPQYFPGHGARIAAVEAALADRLPAVALAGASYRGSGLPACIASGRRAAQLVLQRASLHVAPDSRRPA